MSDKKKVRPDLDRNCFTIWWHSWKIFLKMLMWKHGWCKSIGNYPACKELKNSVQPLDRFSGLVFSVGHSWSRKISNYNIQLLQRCSWYYCSLWCNRPGLCSFIILRHLVWVFTVCQSTHLGISNMYTKVNQLVIRTPDSPLYQQNGKSYNQNIGFIDMQKILA